MVAAGKNRRRPLLGLNPARGYDVRTIARYQGALFLGGTALGALTLILPHPQQFDDVALWTNLGMSLTVGLTVIAVAGRLPLWTLQVVLLMGTAIVTRSIYYSQEPSTYYSFFYLWISLYAFYVFGRAWGLIQTAMVGAAYAWVLVEIHSSTALSRWVMTVFSITAAGLLLDLLVRQVRRREAEATNQARALTAVGSVAHDLALRTTIESAAPAICDAAVDVTGATGASLWQPTADGSGLKATAATDPPLVGSVVLLTGPPSGAIRAFNTRQQLFVPEAEGSPEVDQGIVARLGVASILFQPVMRDDNAIGVLVLYWDQPVSAIPEGDDTVIALLAAEASIAIERTEMLGRLERAARTDDLTGLPNRRAWGEHLAREVARAERLGTPLCVAMLDLDRFKEYNDRHGHQAGDRFLKEAAAAWQARTREADLIARYGGEEFAIAMVACGLEEAVEMLELLRAETPEGASCSAGVALWDGSETDDELVARADRSLYEAKRRGRDRVISSR